MASVELDPTYNFRSETFANKLVVISAQDKKAIVFFIVIPSKIGFKNVRVYFMLFVNLGVKPSKDYMVLVLSCPQAAKISSPFVVLTIVLK